MKRYIIYGEKQNGEVDRYQCFAQSKDEAEHRIMANFGEVIRATAFDYKFSIYDDLRRARK